MTPSELMDDLFKNPALSLGYGSINRMQYFIAGYINALQDNNLEADDSLYSGFSSWVCNRYKITDPRDWVSVIKFYSPNEQQAFLIAKNLWAEYKAETKSLDPVNK